MRKILPLLFLALLFISLPLSLKVEATQVQNPTNFLSCGSDYLRELQIYGNDVIRECTIQAPIVDSSGNPIPKDKNPKLTFHVASGVQDNTQPEGDFSIPLNTTTSYTYCSFTQQAWDQHRTQTYPTVFTFHASADGYANSPDFIMDASNPCNDKNTKQPFGEIALQTSNITYGCYTDGACHASTEKPGIAAVETFGTDPTCNNQCGTWSVYDQSKAGVTGPQYVCRDPNSSTAKPADGATVVDASQTFYVLQACQDAATNANVDKATQPASSCSTPDQITTACNPNNELVPAAICDGVTDSSYQCDKDNICKADDGTPMCDTGDPLPVRPPCSLGLQFPFKLVADKNDTFATQPPTNTTNPAKIDLCLEYESSLGLIPVDTTDFVQKMFAILLSLTGGIILILLIYSGYQLLLSQGNPDKVKEAR
ncbi:MAG TPA: hypothetical protein VG935_01540, partial [Patescibacteria group bacterium]|nr:hypothetical protein [Patescibacteria group bacterium]